MKANKERVIQELAQKHSKENVRYNELYNLLRTTDGVSKNQLNFLNRTGFNKGNLATVEFELKKLHKISDRDVRNYDAVTPKEPKQEIPKMVIVLSEETKEIQEEIKKVINDASDDVKLEIKFRDEFPFLQNEDCPLELKALVNDKFNHYHSFCESNKELFDKVVLPWIEGKKEFETDQQITNDIIFGLAKSCLENFIGDQAIYDELLHYRETKTILGKHEIFAKNTQAVNPFIGKTPIELAKKKSNLENYIRRENSSADKAKDETEKQKFLAKSANFSLQLDQVNELLDVKK